MHERGLLNSEAFAAKSYALLFVRKHTHLGSDDHVTGVLARCLSRDVTHCDWGKGTNPQKQKHKTKMNGLKCHKWHFQIYPNAENNYPWANFQILII